MRTRSLAIPVFFLLTLPLGAATNIFGPKTYTKTSSAPQTTDDVAAASPACNGVESFVLHVENHGISSAEVSINGNVVLRPSDFTAIPATLERAVRLQASNRIKVTISGGRNDGNLVLAIRQEVEQPLADRTFTLTSKKQSFDETLSIPNPAATWVLFVANGAPRVAKGSISINGETVITDRDLNDGTDVVRRIVALQASNDLRVDLSGDSGAAITASFRQLTDESACAPVITISAPTANAIVRETPLHVTGTISGGRDIGVSVNGRAASLDLAHSGTLSDPYRWVARVDAEEEGLLTIAASARTPNGTTVTASVPVTVLLDADPMRVIASKTSVVAPAKVTFQLDGAPAGATKYEADLDGNGSFEIMSATAPSLVANYTTAGMRAVTVRVTSPSATKTATTYVTVADFGTLDLLLRQRWAAFRAALAAGDVAGAMQYVVDDGAREKYGDAFNLLLPRLPAVAASMDGILPMYIRGDYASYLLTRVENGQMMGYSVYFIRDEDGLWRVAQF